MSRPESSPNPDQSQPPPSVEQSEPSLLAELENSMSRHSLAIDHFRQVGDRYLGMLWLGSGASDLAEVERDYRQPRAILNN